MAQFINISVLQENANTFIVAAHERLLQIAVPTGPLPVVCGVKFDTPRVGVGHIRLVVRPVGVKNWEIILPYVLVWTLEICSKLLFHCIMIQILLMVYL